LVIGITVILLIRKKYPRITNKELAAIIALYVVLILLFTDPVIGTLQHYFGG
jgi:hypothetical protein